MIMRECGVRYLGSEPKRGAPYNLNITFISKKEEVGSQTKSC